MIVPMKKVTVVVQDKDKIDLIEKLGKLGILHIEHVQAPSGREINLIKEDIEKLEEAVDILSLFSLEKERKEIGDWKVFIRQVIELKKKIDCLREELNKLKEEIAVWEDWGNFEPKLIKELEGKNILVKFYRIPLREIKKLPSDLVVKEISKKKGMCNCLVIARREIKLPYPEFSLPILSLEEMKREKEKKGSLILSLENELREKSKFIDSLKKIKLDLEREKEFVEVVKGMGEEENLSYLRGYIPEDKVEEFLNFARKEGWGVLVEDPKPEDNVPTLLRNPRWVEILSPLFKILEIFPGYQELDISMWFLIFLSLFFGILIGDAGYGFIYLLLTFLIKKKWKDRIKEKSIFYLLYLLSTSAIIWGLLSGTIFGQEWLSNFIKPIIPSLRDDKTVQGFCFFLGAIHLSIAHLWKFILKLPSLSSLVELGWVFILWGMYFLARMLILGDLLPGFVKFIFLLGFVFILFFTHPQKNIIKGIGKGISNLLLNLVNNFTDVVSYIRLFAVGLATIAIADSFNRMAIDLGYQGFFSGLITSLILLLGHTLNLILGPMSVLVHGVRLNLLEFSNHLGIKWIGFPYKPLKR